MSTNIFILAIAVKNKKYISTAMVNVPGASLKSDLNTIEAPFFSLQKKIDTEQFIWKKGSEKVVITPNKYGRATIWDKDIILYLIGQVAATKNREGEISRTVITTERDILIASNRGDGGDSYMRLKNALRRLRNTSIETNISANGYIEDKEFSLIHEWCAVRNQTTNETIYLEIVMSKWLYELAITKDLVTYHNEYFSITSGLERRLYEIFKKHLYRSPAWKIGIKKLFHKVGGRGSFSRFKFELKKYDGRITGFRFIYDSSTHLINVYPGSLKVKS